MAKPMGSTITRSVTADDLDLVDRFTDAQATNGLSVKTILNQTKVLVRLGADLPGGLAEATTEEIADWLQGRSLTATSRRSYLSILRTFYNWAWNERVVATDPIKAFSPTHGDDAIGWMDHIEMVREYRISQERRGLARGTILARANSLRLMHRWAEPRSVLDLSTEDIERWLDTRRLSTNSRAHAISNVAMFYRWAVKAGLLEANPAEAIERPTVRRGLPRPMPVDDLVEAVERATRPDMRCWLLLAAYQGLRACEMAGLTREDVLDTVDPPLLLVRKGKGRKERLLPLHPDVLAQLHRYRMPSSGILFPWGRAGRQRPAPTITGPTNYYLHSLGIESTLHQGRHWFATSIYRETLDLRLLQELLGHSDPSTTAVYAAWSPGKAVGAVTGLRMGLAG